MGKQMALEAFIVSSGSLVSRFSQPERVYEKGPAKGLTKALAPQKFQAVWSKVEESVKLKYALQAYESGRGTDVAAYLAKKEAKNGNESGDLRIVGDMVYKNNVPYGKMSGGVVVPFSQD